MPESLAAIVHLAYPFQALIATLCTWSITALGACVVFLLKTPNRNLMDALLGMAGGVMIAASFWSLLSPSIEMAQALDMSPWGTAALGFLGGGVLLFLGDRAFHAISERRRALPSPSMDESGWKRCTMLIFSITLHNIPEGMAIGVAFGSLAYGLEGSTPGGAWLLALGIGLQNLPEGMAVSVPLRREGLSRRQSFFYGQLSGLAEPVSGFLGALLVLKVRSCLPFLLAFAAGAMIYVVTEGSLWTPPVSSSRRSACSSLFFSSNLLHIEPPPLLFLHSEVVLCKCMVFSPPNFKPCYLSSET